MAEKTVKTVWQPVWTLWLRHGGDRSGWKSGPGSGRQGSS
jgi:hypothetical protein